MAKAAEQARQVAVRDLTIKEQRTREGLLAELSQRFTSDPDSRKIRQSIRSADTIMHLLGVDHKKLIYKFQGRDYRLTDVHGHVVKPILS